MTTVHGFLHELKETMADPGKSVIHGPSTQNKIERWWRELLERLERYFKQQLNQLLENGDYDPGNEVHR